MPTLNGNQFQFQFHTCPFLTCACEMCNRFNGRSLVHLSFSLDLFLSLTTCSIENITKRSTRGEKLRVFSQASSSSFQITIQYDASTIHPFLGFGFHSQWRSRLGRGYRQVWIDSRARTTEDRQYFSPHPSVIFRCFFKNLVANSESITLEHLAIRWRCTWFCFKSGRYQTRIHLVISKTFSSSNLFRVLFRTLAVNSKDQKI